MQKQRIIAFCVVCASGAALLVLTHSKEPSYNGHRLTYWVRILGSMQRSEQESQMAKEAVDHIGVAAAPFLIKWIQFNPTKWTDLQKTLAELLCKAHYSFVRQMGQNLYYPKGERLANGASEGFRILGTRATPQLDELCRVMNDLSAPHDSRSGLSRADRATGSLSCLGTAALPALTAVIQNPHRPRWTALNSIWVMARSQRTALFPITGNIDGFEDANNSNNSLSLMFEHDYAAQFPITAIIACLEDTKDPNVPRKAAEILVELKQAPELCIPAFVSGLQSNSHYTRASSAWALGQFGKQAASAIGALTTAMTDSDSEVRYNAANALQAIAPNAYLKVPQPYWEMEGCIFIR